MVVLTFSHMFDMAHGIIREPCNTLICFPFLACRRVNNRAMVAISHMPMGLALSYR